MTVLRIERITYDDDGTVITLSNGDTLGGVTRVKTQGVAVPTFEIHGLIFPQESKGDNKA